MKLPMKLITEAKKGTAMAVATTTASSAVRRDMDIIVNFQLLCLISSSSCGRQAADEAGSTHERQTNTHAEMRCMHEREEMLLLTLRALAAEGRPTHSDCGYWVTLAPARHQCSYLHGHCNRRQCQCQLADGVDDHQPHGYHSRGSIGRHHLCRTARVMQAGAEACWSAKLWKDTCAANRAAKSMDVCRPALDDDPSRSWYVC